MVVYDVTQLFCVPSNPPLPASNAPSTPPNNKILPSYPTHTKKNTHPTKTRLSAVAHCCGE